MLSDLVADDSKVASSAALTLFYVRPLPPGADKAIGRAIASQLQKPRFGEDLNLLAWLMELAGEDLKAFLHDPNESVRNAAQAAIEHPWPPRRK